MKNIPLTLTAVQYIGDQNPFVERNYRTGLTFTPLQTRMLPTAIANRLLRHQDAFKPGQPAEQSEAAVGKLSADDTAAQLTVADAKNKAEATALTQLQDMVCQINTMDKDALKDFAQVKYGQSLPKTLSVENMRTKVVGMIDQFGLV